MIRKIFLTAVFIILLTHNLGADAGDGYDLNTEVTLAGVVAGVDEGMRGPCVFTLLSSDKTYKVVTGPRWYLNQIGLAVKTQMSVVVTGSKFYDRNGGLYISAFSIVIPSESKTYRFRDSNSQSPLWHGHGRWR
ncbi:MAG: OB-fold nucleic acid binding domain-containing protein [Nitrospirae bacterium YQR-1]